MILKKTCASLILKKRQGVEYKRILKSLGARVIEDPIKVQGAKYQSNILITHDS